MRERIRSSLVLQVLLVKMVLLEQPDRSAQLALLVQPVHKVR